MSDTISNIEYTYTGTEPRQISFAVHVDAVLEEVSDMLISKNKAYGDAALSPTQIFSKLSSEEGIKVRIDDKLSRIKNSGFNDETEDTVLDLIGYLILLRIKNKEGSI